jgi:L-amino acid N-acyltransferase YncA
VTAVEIRNAAPSDVPEMNVIYNRYIVGSHVSFDTEPWTDAQRQAWFEHRSTEGYPVMVAVRAGSVIGAVWSGPWFGEGIGTSLYTALLEELRTRGFAVAIGVVALPNDASVALHRKLGYREVGVLEGVGLKDGKRHSTMLLELQLDPGTR